jgi:hypothetical protein
VRAIGANAANGSGTAQQHDGCSKAIEKAIAEMRKEMQQIKRQFNANCSKSQLSGPVSRPGWPNQAELGAAYGATFSGQVNNNAPIAAASMNPDWSSQWMDRTTGPPLSEPADASALVNQQRVLRANEQLGKMQVGTMSNGHVANSQYLEIRVRCVYRRVTGVGSAHCAIKTYPLLAKKIRKPEFQVLLVVRLTQKHIWM